MKRIKESRQLIAVIGLDSDVDLRDLRKKALGKELSVGAPPRSGDVARWYGWPIGLVLSIDVRSQGDDAARILAAAVAARRVARAREKAAKANCSKTSKSSARKAKR